MSEGNECMSMEKEAFLAFQLAILPLWYYWVSTKKEKTMYGHLETVPTFPLVSGADFTECPSDYCGKYMYLYGVWELPRPHVANDFCYCEYKTLQMVGRRNYFRTKYWTRTGKSFFQRRQRTHQSRQAFTQNFIVENPNLWSPETPALYKAETESMPTTSYR